MQRIRIRCERGQTMAEYGVILAVLTVGVVGALLVFSGQLVEAVERVAAQVR